MVARVVRYGWARGPDAVARRREGRPAGRPSLPAVRPPRV